MWSLLWLSVIFSHQCLLYSQKVERNISKLVPHSPVLNCEPSFCDPAPIFKLVEASTVELDTKFILLDVLYPSNDPQYQRYLLDPARKRLCNGKSFVSSNCSFFHEFVFPSDTEPLLVIAINDPAFEGLYNRLQLLTADILAKESNEKVSFEEEIYFDVDFEIKSYFYGALLLVSVLVIICLCLIICIVKQKPSSMEHPSSPSPLPPPRRYNVQVKKQWTTAVNNAKCTKKWPDLNRLNSVQNIVHRNDAILLKTFKIKGPCIDSETGVSNSNT